LVDHSPNHDNKSEEDQKPEKVEHSVRSKLALPILRRFRGRKKLIDSRKSLQEFVSTLTENLGKGSWTLELDVETETHGGTAHLGLKDTPLDVASGGLTPRKEVFHIKLTHETKEDKPAHSDYINTEHIGEEPTPNSK